MAFTTKYRCEWTDLLGVDHKTDIQADGVWTITTLQASAPAASIEWFGEDDIFEQTIMGSRLTLNIEVETDFAYDELFTSDPLEFKVIHYIGGVAKWYGWIEVGMYQEPYNGVPFSTSLTAVDGLGILKNFTFDNLNYTERETMAEMLISILGEVGITTYTEYLNVYESTMDAAVGDSPLDQAGIDPALFAGQTCYDALETMLFSLNAGIRQNRGVFEIFRYNELKSTMYGRVWTSSINKSSTSKNPAQYINRPLDPSVFSDRNGGTRMGLMQAKTVNVNQDYGFKESILKNYDFDYTTYSDPDFEEWTRSAGADINTLAGTVPGAGDKGVVFDSMGNAINYNISQDVPVYTTADTMVMEFNIGAFGPATNGQIYVKVTSTDGVDTKYLQQVPAWAVTDVEVLLDTIVSSANGTTSTVRVQVAGIPYTGTMTVQLYSALSTASDVRAIWKDVKFFFPNANGVVMEGVGYTIAGTTTGQIIDKDFILGDGYGFTHDLMQYKGALNVWSGSDAISTSKSWFTRGNTENIPLTQLMGTEIKNQYARNKDYIDLPFIESSDLLDLNGNIQDSHNQYSSSNRIFAISRAVFDLYNREYNLTLTELL